MKKIEKYSEPVELIDFKKRNPKKIYDDIDKELRIVIRRYMVKEQKYICGYCCRQISSDTSTNEHIKPRSIYPQDSLDYNNLIASCHDKTSCDKHKAHTYDPKLFISPLEADCSSHFRFHSDGEIEGLDERAKYAIGVLNLNSRSLRTARRNYMKELQDMPSEYIQYLLTEDDSKLPVFADMLEYFLSVGYYRKK